MSDVTTIAADVPASYADAVEQRLQRAHDEDVDGAHVAPRRHAVGARGHARGHEPARLARHRRPHERAARRARARSPRTCAARATPTRCCSAWAARASRPRSSGARFGERRRRTAPARARLHAPRPGARRARRGRPRQDGVHRLLEVGRDDRADVACSRRFHERQSDGAHYVAVTDPGSLAGRPRARERLPPRLPRRPGHRRALQRAVALRPRPGGAGRRRHRRGARRRARRRRGVPSSRTPTRGCGSAARSASSRCAAATS